MPLVRAEANEALSLDPSNPGPHFLLASVAAASSTIGRRPAQHFSIAMAGASVSAEAHWAYASLYFQPWGRFEGGCAREHLVEHGAEAEDVRPLIERAALRLLGGHVGRRAEHGAFDRSASGPPSAAMSLARPKSARLDGRWAGRPGAASDEDVGGLQVAMEDAPLMGSVESTDNLETPAGLLRPVRADPFGGAPSLYSSTR